MKFHTLVICLLLSIFLFSCNRIENKARQLGDRAKAKTKQVIVKNIRDILTKEQPNDFSIRYIVTDFKNDKGIIEIKSIQIESVLFYTDYCVYRGEKNRVLKGINKIAADSSYDIKSDDQCYLVDAQTFYNDSDTYENNQHTAFFWEFKKLKAFEVYTCTKMPWRHYIIFNKNSDTVYHRIDEIRD